MSARKLSGRLIATAKASRATITSLRDRCQIHGRFSIQRIEDLRDYYNSQATWFRVLLVYLVTPIPALLVITLVDCIPLSPPEAGCDANYVYWIRLIPIVWILVAGAIQSFRCCLPALPMSQLELFTIAFLAALAGVSWAYGVSVFVGFPVPFNFVVQSFSILPVLILLFRMLWRKSLLAKPSLQADLRQLILVLVGQCTMTYIFPLYLFAFLAMPPRAQVVFTLAIPLIKIGLKRYFSRSLRRLDDLKPAFIVFNVNVFSAFYIASCLQATRSWQNTMIIMIIDVVQGAISFYRVHTALRDINAFVPVDTFDGSLLDLCIEAAAPLQIRQELDQRVTSASFGTKRHLNFRVSSAIIPTSSIPSKASSASQRQQALLTSSLQTPERVRLADKITRLLYITELILLNEFTEVIIPVMYGAYAVYRLIDHVIAHDGVDAGIYLLAISHLPNRAYYPQLASLNEEEFTRSISAVMMNAALELISLVGISWLLSHKLKLSSTRLLSFALEHQPVTIHSVLTLLFASLGSAQGDSIVKKKERMRRCTWTMKPNLTGCDVLRDEFLSAKVGAHTLQWTREFLLTSEAYNNLLAASSNNNCDGPNPCLSP